MNIIDNQLAQNMGHTYFGGKDGFDYICFDNSGKIQCSGKLQDMLKYAEENNLAVAILIPVRFTNVKKEK